MIECINENEFILTCDICGRMVTEFYNLEEIYYYKKIIGWKEIESGSDVFDKCPDCLECVEKLTETKDIEKLEKMKEEMLVNSRKNSEEENNLIEKFGYCEVSGKNFAKNGCVIITKGYINDILKVLTFIVKHISKNFEISVKEILTYISENLKTEKQQKTKEKIKKLVLIAREGKLIKRLNESKGMTEEQDDDFREYLHKKWHENPNRDYYEMEDDQMLATFEWMEKNNIGYQNKRKIKNSLNKNKYIFNI